MVWRAAWQLERMRRALQSSSLKTKSEECKALEWIHQKTFSWNLIKKVFVGLCTTKFVGRTGAGQFKSFGFGASNGESDFAMTIGLCRVCPIESGANLALRPGFIEYYSNS